LTKLDAVKKLAENMKQV